jgi:hypothetical protein
MSETEQYLIEAADKCARLARLGREIAADLDGMGHDLMARAVAMDTARDRDETTRKKSSRA